MKPYEDHTATRMAEGKLFIYDFEAEEFPGKEDMDKLNTVTNFMEYTCKYAELCGYQGDVSDVSNLATFIVSKCKEANDAAAYENAKMKLSRQTLVNWLTKGLPANTVSGRENVYQLCFALQMNAEQTGEFFLKAYLERPFNYKNIHEAVYFFCMNNDLTYADAMKIIAEVEAMPIMENPYADNITEQIGEQLQSLKTKEELLKYLSDNRSGFAVQNQTATEIIKQLVEDCMAIAPKENAITNPVSNAITVDNIDELLSVIYGYSARAVENAKPVYKKSISKSNFPELIRKNWPQREQFQNILEKKNASYDVIRRVLIMLNFYHFAASSIVGHTLEGGIFDEFKDEMNLVLSECGYVQLYWRNPFDWMIGYCAQSTNPLDTFRGLIEEYYLSDPTVIDQ